MVEDVEVPHRGTASRNAGVRAVALTTLLALGVRLVCTYQSSRVPTARHLIGDAAGYYEWAQRIAAGDWIGRESFYQAPLYPYALAAWFSVAGDSVWTVRVLQAVWGAAACGLLCWAAGRMFERRVGLAAGVMLALYGPAVFFDGILQKASLSNLLICAALAVMSGGEGRFRARRAALLGATASLLCLVRENAIVWHLVWCAWIAFGALEAVRGESEREGCGAVGDAASRGVRMTRRAARVGAYLAGAALVLVPVGIRNAYVGGEFSVTTFQAGPNFYIGNHRGADGRYQPLVRGHETPAFERGDATVLAQQDTGRTMKPGEVSRYWFGRAWKDVKEDPGGWLKLLGCKAMLTWNRYEVSDVESIRVYRSASSLLDVLCAAGHFGMIVPLAVIGAAATRSRWRRLWVHYLLILSMAAAVAAFYVLGRYRYPIVPLLIPFAAAGCVHAWDLLRSRRFAEIAPLAILAIAAALVVNWPIQDERRLDALAEMNAGVALAESGDVRSATALFRQAVAAHPQSAEAHNNLAQALALQGEFAEAIEHYRAALVIEPSLPGVHYNFGVALEAIGRAVEAAGEYALAVEQDPRDREARAALERLSIGQR